MMGITCAHAQMNLPAPVSLPEVPAEVIEKFSADHPYPCNQEITPDEANGRTCMIDAAMVFMRREEAAGVKPDAAIYNFLSYYAALYGTESQRRQLLENYDVYVTDKSTDVITLHGMYIWYPAKARVGKIALLLANKKMEDAVGVVENLSITNSDLQHGSPPQMGGIGFLLKTQRFDDAYIFADRTSNFSFKNFVTTAGKQHFEESELSRLFEFLLSEGRETDALRLKLKINEKSGLYPYMRGDRSFLVYDAYKAAKETSVRNTQANIVLQEFLEKHKIVPNKREDELGELAALFSKGDPEKIQTALNSGDTYISSVKREIMEKFPEIRSHVGRKIVWENFVDYCARNTLGPPTALAGALVNSVMMPEYFSSQENYLVKRIAQ